MRNEGLDGDACTDSFYVEAAPSRPEGFRTPASFQKHGMHLFCSRRPFMMRTMSTLDK